MIGSSACWQVPPPVSGLPRTFLRVDPWIFSPPLFTSMVPPTALVNLIKDKPQNQLLVANTKSVIVVIKRFHK